MKNKKLNKRIISKIKRKILRKEFYDLCKEVGELPTTVLATPYPPSEGKLKEICDMETEKAANKGEKDDGKED